MLECNCLRVYKNEWLCLKIVRIVDEKPSSKTVPVREVTHLNYLRNFLGSWLGDFSSQLLIYHTTVM